MMVLLRVASCKSKKYQLYIGPDKLKGPTGVRDISMRTLNENFKA